MKASDVLSHMRKRVRIHRVAVLGSIGQSPHPAGVHDDDCRTCHCAQVMSMRTSAILKG